MLKETKWKGVRRYDGAVPSHDPEPDGPAGGRSDPQRSYVTGSLDLVGYVNTIQGVQAEDGTLHLFHPIQTIVSTIPCETVLNLQAGNLRGTSTSKSARMRWKGTLIHPETQEESEL